MNLLCGSIRDYWDKLTNLTLTRRAADVVGLVSFSQQKQDLFTPNAFQAQHSCCPHTAPLDDLKLCDSIFEKLATLCGVHIDQEPRWIVTVM
jgi:hypothetical protein